MRAVDNIRETGRLFHVFNLWRLIRKQMKAIITLLFYLTGTLAISCSRSQEKRIENHVPVLAPDAASASTKPNSPVAIQGATFGGSRHELVISFNDQKEYDPKNLAIQVQFFTRGPNGLVPITKGCKPDMTSWGNEVAKNHTHQLRLSEVEDFARMKVDVQITSSENTQVTTIEEDTASKAFDVVEAK